MRAGNVANPRRFTFEGQMGDVIRSFR